MKKFIYVTIAIFSIGSVLTACNQEKEETEVVSNSQTDKMDKDKEQGNVGLSDNEQERIERLEKGIMLYGEGVKGGYYSTTVNSAYSEKVTPEETTSHNSDSVVVSVTLKNVRDDGKTVDPSELQFELREEQGDKSYEGKVLPNKNTTNDHIQPNNSVTLDVSFFVPNVAEEYSFYVINTIDPIEVHWKISNIRSSTK